MGAAAGLILLSATAWLASSLQPDEPAGAAEPSESALSVTGIAVRAEQPVYAPEGEVLVLASEGSRVASGGAVLAVSQTRDGLLCAVRDCVRDSPGIARELARQAVLAAATGSPEGAEALSALYYAPPDEPYELITAPASALWSSETDGLEYLSADSLQDLTPDALANLLALPAEPGGAVGKLVYSGVWYFAAAVPAAYPIEETACATLRFDGFEATARAMYVSEAENSECVVVFAVSDSLKAALGLRVCEAEVIFEA